MRSVQGWEGRPYSGNHKFGCQSRQNQPHEPGEQPQAALLKKAHDPGREAEKEIGDEHNESHGRYQEGVLQEALINSAILPNLKKTSICY